jgi:uncharacterized membrane protein YeaQ/YmgE (transglycosylase-associated protein family)
LDLIISLVVGAIAGAVALFVVYRRVPSEPMQWIGALVVGVIGGWLGGIIFGILGLEDANIIGSLVVAFVGAVIVLLLLQRLSPRGTVGRR